MSRLGFRHNAATDKPMPERLYADKLRRKTGADWAFVVYVVDSLKDDDGAFRNGVIAYTADLFGPYTMLIYDNDGYGFTNFDAVLAHEIGHVFGALDEYKPPRVGYPSTGDLTSGYLGVRNRNAVRGGTTNISCVMRGSNATLRAFTRGDLCPSTIGQTGLRDSDADARPDDDHGEIGADPRTPYTALTFALSSPDAPLAGCLSKAVQGGHHVSQIRDGSRLRAA